MAATKSPLTQALWAQQIPLHITHPEHPNTPFVTALPRFSYLALLLPRLSAFFRPPGPAHGTTAAADSGPDLGRSVSSFHHEDVLLRNLPLGLLVDLYQPSLPWRLTVADGASWDIADTFLNSVKEADYIRNGTAKRIMSLSKDDTAALWNAVQDNDYPAFSRINTTLLNAPTALRNVPLRIFIPSAPATTTASSTPAAEEAAGAFRVLQTLVPPRDPSTRQVQLLGQVLRSLLPMLFPSSRDAILANVILHGGSVPFDAPVEDLMREAAYPDGWLCLIVVPL